MVNSSVAKGSGRDDFAALHLQARRCWPDVDVPFEAFVEYLNATLPRSSESSVAEHVNDLFLVCGCLRGCPSAVRSFVEAHVEPALVAANVANQQDDLRQIVLEKLLSNNGDGRSRLSDYSGRASLRTWLRVVVKRTHLNIIRSQRTGASQDSNEQLENRLISAGNDPELDYLKVRYAYEFKQAFRAAVEQLDARDRLVLKMHVCEGSRTREIAQLIGVNQATVVRWMEGIRQRLLAFTRAHLEQELKLSRAEFESVVRLVLSHVNLTLSCLQES